MNDYSERDANEPDFDIFTGPGPVEFQCDECGRIRKGFPIEDDVVYICWDCARERGRIAWERTQYPEGHFEDLPF